MNCKPGDLAIVTNAACSENIGKIVSIIRRHTDHELFGPCWVIDGSGIEAVVGFNSRRPMARNPAKPVVTPDAWLRPVSGLPIHDEVTDDIKETA